MSFESLNRMLISAILCLIPIDLLGRFGPQKLHQAAQKILKLHAEQPAALTTSMPDIPPTELSAQSVPKMDPTSAPLNGNDEPQATMSEVTSPTTLPLRPTNQQPAHVLIVDDNEINLKVSYCILSWAEIKSFTGPISCSRHVLTSLTDHGSIHAETRLQLRHSIERAHCIGEIFNLQPKVRRHSNGYGRFISPFIHP